MDLFEDDDYELIQYLSYQHRLYSEGIHINHLLAWDDHDFRVRFRLGKSVVRQVLSYIEVEISPQTGHRNNPVPAIDKLLLTLRFYATGNFLITATDFVSVKKTTASLIVRSVSEAIAKLRPAFVRMPETEDQINNLHNDFYNIAQFPRTIGAIGCTHVKIKNPGGINGEWFKNRKGYFSLKVQTISSANLKIMDVVARWPGACRNQLIFEKSRVRSKLESGHWRNSLIVADDSYVNSNYVVTPYLEAVNNVKRLYNKSLVKTSYPVEKSHVILKQRFPVLSFGSRLKIETVQAMVVACCVLHNIACDNNNIEPPELLGINLPVNDDLDLKERNARQELTEDYFPLLS